jgi:L-2-amino-thiazoline-4-carboxylic acid hydrolase
MRIRSRRDRLLRGFDRIARRLRPKLEDRYGSAFAADVLADARRELDLIIPRIPYIGGWRNAFTPVMIVNGWMLALHRAMKARGKSAEDVIRVCAEVSDEFFRSLPGFLLRSIGRLAFLPPVRRFFQKQSQRSQERRYPGDFVFEVRVSDDGEFSLVFEECAVNKFYDAEDARELKPYCNFFDVTYSRLMNMGVDARETIGLGCEKCSLRYKHGRETVVPERLRGLLPDADAGS